MTKTVVAQLLGKQLLLDERLLASIKARFDRMGRPMPTVNRTQAEVPEGAVILPNPRGTAPGLWVEDPGGRVVVLLRGVPREMHGLLVEHVLPRIVARHGSARRVVVSRTGRHRLGVAESCTGGMIGERITNIPGASDTFIGGVVAYADVIKTAALKVPLETLEAYGAVSEETVRAMADGAQRLFSADCTIAVTGIAGPGGGTPEKPVGTVWLA